MFSVAISIKDPTKPPKLIFPDCCVNCGMPNEKVVPVRLNTGAQQRGRMVQLKLDVPLCASCAAQENKIANVTWMPFFIAGLLACILVFIPVWLVSPEGSTPQTYALPYVLGAFVGMIAGIVLGTLVEFVLKIVCAPAYGHLLLKRPLTVFSVFHDTEDLIGLSTRFADKKKTLELTFENDEIARTFVALNPQETG